MPSQLNITSIPSSRVDFIDPRTGLMSREWYRFFLNLYNLTGAGNNPTSLDDLQVGPPAGSGEGNAGTVTSVQVSGGTTGLTTTGGPITSAGTITLGGVLNVANGGTGSSTAGGAPFALKGANSDIISLSGITGAISSPDYVQFDTAYSTTLGVGQLGWDGNNTLGLGMYGGNVVQKIGEDFFYYVKASAAITKGQLCMFTGSVGASGVATAAPSTGVTNGQYIMGVAAESIAHNGFGLIQVFGTLRNVDTSAFADGDVLYYDSAVTGGFTTTFPSSGPIVTCAAVVNGGSAGGGVLQVRVSVTQRITAGSGVSVTQTSSGAVVANTSPSSGGTVTSVATAGTVSGLTLTGGPITTTGTITLGGTLDLSSPPTIGNTTPNTGAFTTLSASSTVSGVGFSDYLASPPAIGGTTPAAGTFTTLTANSTFQAGKSSANYQQIVGAATTLAPVLSVLGSDTNVALAIKTQGTGAIDLAAGSRGVNISNGGTVTAITRTATGSAYTSIPTVTVSAPTTAGGVQATATASLFANTATVSAGGTGYTLNDVVTLVGGTPAGSGATYTVTGVSGGVVTSVSPLNFQSYTALPSNPVSVTGGTGTGLTLTVTYGFQGVTITNAGSGYVEQPTVSFSGGGGSGAAAYATVGSGTVVRSLAQTVDFYVPDGIGFRVSGSASSGGAYLTAFAGSTTPILRGIGSGTFAIQAASAIPIQFQTNASSSAVEQLRVSHTASAVNYVQVTGAATGSNPVISTQGSDAARGLVIATKAGGNMFFASSGGTYTQFAMSGANNAVNYLQVAGTTATNAPILSSQGTDTNIDLTLTPKGTGVLKTTAVTNIGAGTVLAGATNPLVAMTGNTNQYVQSYIVNNNAGTSASSDFVAYANNSTDSHGWADMGFTSSVYADATYTVTGPNEAYLFGSAPSGAGATGNLVYATDSTGSANAHQFYVGGFTQAKGAWKAQIDSTGLKATQVNATNGLLVNSMTVSASYTVASGDSAMSVGPITVSSGASVTVSSGSRWVIM